MGSKTTVVSREDALAQRQWYVIDADGGFSEGSWMATDDGWLVKSEATMPDGGTVAIETSLTDDRYFATRAVVLDDRRTVVTVEFVCDTYDEMLRHVERLAKNTAIKFAISPSIDIHWPLALERRRAVVLAKCLPGEPRRGGLVACKDAESADLPMRPLQLEEEIGRAHV